MIKYRLNHEFHKDVERIQRVMKEHGYDIDYFSASEIWTLISESFCAQWLIMPESDEELFKDIDMNIRKIELNNTRE